MSFKLRLGIIGLLALHAFAASANTSKALYDCVNLPSSVNLNDPGSWPKNCQGNQDIPFTLLTRDGQPISGFYEMSGKKCPATVTQATAECPFKVVTKFRAQCPDNPASGPQLTNSSGKCALPLSIKVKWALTQDFNTPGNIPMKGVVADDNTEIKAVPISIQNIKAIQFTSYNCPPIQETVDGKVRTYQQVVVGRDAWGNPKCGKDPNQDTIDAMQKKLCDIETAQVNSNGGITTTCDPPYAKLLLNDNSNYTTCASPGFTADLSGNARPVTTSSNKIFVNGVELTPSNFDNYNKKLMCAYPLPKLANSTRNTKNCTDAGGALMSSAGTGITVSVPVTKSVYDTHNNTAFCRFSGSGCPSGWTMHGGWSTTSQNSTNILTRYVTHSVSAGCGYSWSPNGCSSPQACPGTTARDGSQCHSGSHGWSNNAAIESATCYNYLRNNPTGTCGSEGGGCNCTHKSGSTDGNYIVSATATRTQVGCR